eukprot:6239764-Lingulodinium_polyedra.AAC.1
MQRLPTPIPSVLGSRKRRWHLSTLSPSPRPHRRSCLHESACSGSCGFSRSSSGSGGFSRSS